MLIVSDFIFVKIYSKFDVRKQKLSLNHRKIKAIHRDLLAPDLSLSIILTLLSMCSTKM
jgi:hypothetical protein